jgi:hypothetical protein
MEFKPIPVFPGRRKPDLGFRRIGNTADATEGVLQNAGFFGNLNFIGQMLQGTAAADPVKGTAGILPQGRGLRQFHQFRPAVFPVGDPSYHHIPRGGKADKKTPSPVMQNSVSPGGDVFHRGGK